MRKILLITYAFPPVGGIMVQRILSLAKYLPAQGFEVHVLTPRNPATPVFDHELLKQVPAEVVVHRSFTPEPPFYLRKKIWDRISPPSKGEQKAAASNGSVSLKSRISNAVKRQLTPDVQVLWTPFAIRRASAIIRKHNIDTVLVTAPPFSLFLVGNELKRRFPQIKLISDFRDEWLRFMLTDFAFLSGDEFRLKAERIERETIESSDLVVAVTRTSLQEIRGRYPRQPDSKFAFIPNGYDPQVFQGFTQRRHEGANTVITHVGTAYKTSSPAYFLDALRSLPDETRSHIETRFIGRIAETEQQLLDSYKEIVKVHGFMPQQQAMRFMEETDYLLLTMTNDFSLPGKLFEYMASGKTVLALSPRGGEVDVILRETGGGWCVEHSDPDAIRDMLLRAVAAVHSGNSDLQRDEAAVRRYERPRLVAELAGIIKDRLRLS